MAEPAPERPTPETAGDFAPQIGDLWEDHGGDLWFVCANEEEDFYLDMVCETGQRTSPDHVEQHYAPLTLWHRPYSERKADG